MKITNLFKKPGRSGTGLHLALAGLLSLSGAAVAAEETTILDCPLRDAPYSVDLPLIEILLKPEAKALANQYLGGSLEKMPPNFAGTETPSFSTIISLRTVAGMGGSVPEGMDELDAQLAKLEITDADRRARCARYDNEVPEFDLGDNNVNILVFHKINGFDHGPSVTAATHAIQSLGEQMAWGVAVTDMPGVFNAESLAKFDAVIWNNNSGDVLTLSQRKAFEDYINNGGGYLGVHGAGGDFLYLWDWYVDTLLGARFIGHPMEPQFQDAQIYVEENDGEVGADLIPGWTMKDEWYSFANNPREKGAEVVATLDESTYIPEGRGGQDLRMGEDHPIVWTQCVGKGRSMYTAIGHRPEVYHIPENLILLRDGLRWVAGQGNASCGDE